MVALKLVDISEANGSGNGPRRKERKRPPRRRGPAGPARRRDRGPVISPVRPRSGPDCPPRQRRLSVVDTEHAGQEGFALVRADQAGPERRALHPAGTRGATPAAAPGARNMTRPVAASRRRRVFFWRRVVVLFGVACVGAGAWAAGGRLVAVAGAEPSRPLVQHVYVARPGDTIWAIAVRFSGGGDPRPLADALEAQIGGGVLQPGEQLTVP